MQAIPLLESLPSSLPSGPLRRSGSTIVSRALPGRDLADILLAPRQVGGAGKRNLIFKMNPAALALANGTSLVGNVTDELGNVFTGTAAAAADRPPVYLSRYGPLGGVPVFWCRGGGLLRSATLGFQGQSTTFVIIGHDPGGVDDGHFVTWGGDTNNNNGYGIGNDGLTMTDFAADATNTFHPNNDGWNHSANSGSLNWLQTVTAEPFVFICRQDAAGGTVWWNSLFSGANKFPAMANCLYTGLALLGSSTAGGHPWGGYLALGLAIDDALTDQEIKDLGMRYYAEYSPDVIQPTRALDLLLLWQGDSRSAGNSLQSKRYVPSQAARKGLAGCPVVVRNNAMVGEKHTTDKTNSWDKLSRQLTGPGQPSILVTEMGYNTLATGTLATLQGQVTTYCTNAKNAYVTYNLHCTEADVTTINGQPRGATNLDGFNDWLWAQLGTLSGLNGVIFRHRCARVGNPGASLDTGSPNGAYQSDNLHPQPLGAQLDGAFVASAIKLFFWDEWQITRHTFRIAAWDGATFPFALMPLRKKSNNNALPRDQTYMLGFRGIGSRTDGGGAEQFALDQTLIVNVVGGAVQAAVSPWPAQDRTYFNAAPNTLLFSTPASFVNVASAGNFPGWLLLPLQFTGVAGRSYEIGVEITILSGG